MAATKLSKNGLKAFLISRGFPFFRAATIEAGLPIAPVNNAEYALATDFQEATNPAPNDWPNAAYTSSDVTMIKIAPITKPVIRARKGINIACPVLRRRDFGDEEGRMISSKKICKAFFLFSSGFLSKETLPLQGNGYFLDFSGGF